MANHDENHRCVVEKNVPIALILPSRWQDGAESLGTRALAVNGLGMPFQALSTTRYTGQ